MAENPPPAPADISGAATRNAFYVDLAGTLLVPYLIFYLVHIPGTRLIRLALLPLAYIAALRLLFLGGFPSTGEADGVDDELMFEQCPPRWAMSW